MTVDSVSCVFLTMPTSGTGSLWRIITAVAGSKYRLVKVSEEYENSGRGAALPSWVPEPVGHIYMYNTPHMVNEAFNNPDLKLITNFRDPRDLTCNQYHWALQHPIANKSDEEVQSFRRSVEEGGIDKFALKQDNNVLFKSLMYIADRMNINDENVLSLSYGQLCLDFDNLVARLAKFLGVAVNADLRGSVEKERTVNLDSNPDWIGKVWSGSDIMPGRYGHELSPQTIGVLDDRYRASLKFVRSIELPHLRPLLATEVEREEMSRVIFGKESELFLKNDGNDTLAQITGKTKVSFSTCTNIAMAHRTRQLFGATAGNFRYGHAIIPSKEVAHRRLLPNSIVFEGEGGRPVQQYFDLGLTSVWRPFYEPQLLEPGLGDRFYPKTDSHWNHAGAVRYFSAFLSSVDAKSARDLDDFSVRRFPSHQRGDLGLKLEMKTEPIEILAPAAVKSRIVFDNAIVNEGCIKWFRNEHVTGNETLLFFHDSFGLWLQSIVPELFAEVVFMHGTIFDFEFVKKLEPTLVLCMQAERFFPRAPETGGNVLKFVADQERQKNGHYHLSDFLKSDPRFAH